MSRVAIVVINWHSAKHTINCLSSLEAIRTNHELQVYVLDNGSVPPEHWDIAAKFPWVEVRRSEVNLGFAGGNNYLLKEIRTLDFDYFLLLNNDTFVEKDFLDPLMQRARRQGPNTLVQPLIGYAMDRSKVWNSGGKINPWSGQSITLGYQKALDEWLDKPAFQIDWFTGCCVLCPLNLLGDKDFFRPAYFAYNEDVEASLRLRDMGLNIWLEPRSLIFHVAGGSGRKRDKANEGNILPILHYYNLRNRLWTLRLHNNFYHITAFVFQWAKIFAYSGYFLLSGKFIKLNMAMRALKDGMLKKLTNLH